jgi:Dyp-type peroxidase family
MTNADASSSLPLDTIQGNVLASFAKDHQAFLLLRLPHDVAHARQWIMAMSDEVVSQAEVSMFNQLFKMLHARHHRDVRVVQTTWTQLLLSAAGLKRLGVSDDEIQTVSPALREGMKARAAQLGDAAESDPSTWVPSFRTGGIDAVVVVAADDADDLAHQVAQLEQLAHRHQVEVVDKRTGATLPSALRGHEHFGFKDGISQPAVDDPAMLGRFVLGLTPGPAPAPWPVPTTLPAWAVGASLGVLRVLHQDVGGFRSWTAANAGPAGVSPEALGAKLVGRWASGAPLALTPDADDPAVAADKDRNDAFDYSDDSEGLKTPRFAHIRKANPRAESPGPVGGAAESEQRRMLRRGIPYGHPLPAGRTTDDHHDRGLIFLAFMASIEGQFEFVQESWCNDPSFPVGPTAVAGGNYQPQGQEPADGPDPIVGQHHGQGHDTLRAGGGFHDLPLQQFVSTRGGEYLVSLSIPALVLLGSAPTA